MRVPLALLCVVFPSVALAQMPAPPPVLVNSESCPLELPQDPSPPGGWTEAERYAWSRICIGKVANMSFAGPDGSDGAVCNAWEIEGDIPTNRILRPEFLHLILTKEPWSNLRALAFTRIDCAVFERQVNLETSRIETAPLLQQTWFKQGLNLREARIERSLSLIGSQVNGTLFAERMRVGEGLFLKDGSFLSGGLETGAVNLSSAKISGTLSASGARFEGTFQAQRAQVGEDLFLRSNASFDGVGLTGAEIGGNVEATNSRFDGALIASRLKVGGDLFLSGHARFGLVSLVGVRVGEFLQMSGATFTDKVDLSGATMQELLLYVPGTMQKYEAKSDDPIWTGRAELVLRNARAGAVQSRASSWVRDGKALPVDLGGFRYERLEGFEARLQTSLIDLSEADLVAWLEDGRGPNAEYDPQPYAQLAEVLVAAGMEEKAMAVRFAQFVHRDRATRNETALWKTHLVRPAAKWIIGYGVYPFWALGWFFGMVILGIFVAFASKAELIAPFYRKFWYSLENALPLVQFSDAHAGIEHGNAWVESYFHLQKVLGFVLATVLVGALTLLPG